MENQESLLLLASEVMISEEDRLDPVFLHVQFKLADDAGNLNREGVSEAFIQDLMERQDEFTCLPMYVDMKRLLAGDFDNLTHLYNKVTKKFGTQQFGSFTNFSAEKDENGVVSLFGEARFPKRELQACQRLVELYEAGRLSLSIELRYNPEFTYVKDGIKFVDANEDNALTGAAIVSVPAYSGAVALDMVAEADPSIVTGGEEPTNRGETELKKGKDEMLMSEAAPESVEQETETAIAEEVPAESESAEENQISEAEEQEPEQAENIVAEAGEPEVPAEPKTEAETAVAEADETATAEVLSHSVDTHESVENWGGGDPVHVIEVTERIVETLEDANAMIAEQKKNIANLEHQIAELREIEAKYNQIIAEREAQELAGKQAAARAFAERQGLDVANEDVARAIEALDYTMIAELTMAQVREEEKPEEPAEPMISLASFVELEVGDDNAYGGLLKPRSNK